MNCLKITLVVFCCAILLGSVVTSKNKQGKILRTRKTNNKISDDIINKNGQPEVQLEGGLVILGKNYTTTDQNRPYYSFQGIPFAIPPIGELRFRSPLPLPLSSWQSPFEAYESGSVCLQTPLGSLDVIGAEDCLYLNVYVAPGQNKSLLPVMVWIYGGAFIIGESSYDRYGPDYLLDRGEIIIVTINYRLGVLGFLSTEDDACPGNNGLKDQVLGLKWLQRHLRAFGGDPERVTIFGESAGAASVSYLMQSPLTKGLFERAILESGTSLTLWSLTRKPRSFALLMATELHIDTSSSESIINGLRKIPAKKLQSTQSLIYTEQLLAKNPFDGLPLGPTMEAPGPDAIVVNRSYQQIASGQFNHIPCIIGFNSMESLPFIQLIDYVRLYLIKYDLSLNTLVPASMNIYDPLKLDEVNLKIKSHYFGMVPVTLSNKRLRQFVSDDQFNRPIIQSVLLYSKYAPVYMYMFAYVGSLGSSNNTMGVGHAAELPYIWRSSQDKNFATKSDLLTILRLTTLWTNFAKTGNPTPFAGPLFDNVIWPLVNESGSDDIAYLNINNTIKTGVNPNFENEGFWKNLFEEFGNPPYSTY